MTCFRRTINNDDDENNGNVPAIIIPASNMSVIGDS